MSGFEVVLATHNQHKVEEFQTLLGREIPEIAVVSYDGPEPVEDGTTFEANALIKARAAARHSGRVSLADDSGIAVDILGGSPGIFSARWSGHGASGEANRELLLDQLADIADDARGARMVCAIAIVVPGPGGDIADERVVIGEWRGRLARAAAGDGGFGYDPIFLPEDADGTAAELSADRKSELSHRARALAAALPVLNEIRAAGESPS